MKQYTVGLVFDATLEHVLLLHKQKPTWQIGKLNGLGGKVEPDETPIECVARECLEETCLTIPPADWTQFATVINPTSMGDHTAQIDFFATRYSGQMSDAKQGDYEAVEWFPIGNLPENCLQNLFFITPMARESLRGHVATITINY